MSDVLSAEEVEGFVRRVEARYIDFDAFAALARSHEQLRGERDGCRMSQEEGREIAGEIVNVLDDSVRRTLDHRDCCVHCDVSQGVDRVRAEVDSLRDKLAAAEAAARAAGCAADLAEALRGIAVFCARYSDKRLAGIQECATQALISYDRAVSGQTAEKETA